MKKKKQGVNGSLLVFVLLLIIAAVFGYSFVQFYQERNTPTVIHQPEERKTTPSDTKPGDSGSFDPKRSEDQPTEPTDSPDSKDSELALYQTRLAELETSIGKINASVESALQQLSLRLTGRSAKTEEVEIFDGVVLHWEKVSGTLSIPSGKYTLSHVSDRLMTAVRTVGGDVIRVEQDGGGQIVSLGLMYEGTEIITHHLKLIMEEKRPTPKPQPTKPRVKGNAKLAFVIDDLGYEWPEFDRMMTIPRPMTFAVIPHLPYSTQQAQKAWSKGYDLIMHQPMEPSAKNNPGPGAIYTTMSEEEIIKILSDNLGSLPQGVIGANNHMGSKATSDPRVMEIVLRFFRDRGLFFVDSHTSPTTVVAEVARDVGTSFGENRIFLDNVDEFEPIKEQIRKAAKIALRDGYAITIGHVRKYTAKAILAMIDEIEGMGIEIVPAKELLERY